ncbi:MAG: hypothetical protein HY823_10345 [Acidobacteria bacterium]|nr:hypothetical protein [Acidobacteriota bacterium]
MRSPALPALTLLALLLAASPAPAQAKDKPSAASEKPAALSMVSALANLKFREIGPAVMGGRVDDFAVVESNPSIVYAGTASGGLWKTINAGTTWTPLFDKEAVSTIGDVTVAPSDPSIVWVGTGEANNRQSSSWGHGVYRSTDGGATWQNMGLKDTHHIGRVVIHPTNPDIVYVAAQGRLWGPSKERGLYKTMDGGKTWKLVLFVNEDTGVTDLVMDPASPDTLYAAAYQRRRTVFGFSGSGPDGGIHKSTDGGQTWKKLQKGLPWDPEPPRPRSTGGPSAEMMAMFGITPPEEPPAPEAKPEPGKRSEIGRIGLAVYRKDPRIVYAVVEHEKGGVFRSEDRGETWQRMSDTNPRAMYYSQIVVDPTNDLRIWVMGANMYNSEDGGKTFRQDLVQRIHGDYHAMWINPANPDHVILGSDGGIHWSWDRGRSWDFVNNIAIGQFYEVGVDMRQPYWIYGGLQDNNTWGGPSRSMNPRGITNADWLTVGGGDGFFAQVDPKDPNTVYAESQDGNLLRRDIRTGEQRSIRPQPEEGEKPFRFQWNSPIVISATDHRTLYYGGNFLFKSTDRGDSWTRVSPDLTSGADRDKLPILGVVPDKQTRSRHDGVQQWPAITTVAESPVDAQVLWAGTDDGLLHVTRDGGKTWKNVFDRLPGAPKGTYVSRVVASRGGPGAAYATLDGHRSNDFAIYAYATSDFGETWKKITRGIPENQGVLNVIREHPRNPNLLFAGGEFGAYASWDKGQTWNPLRLNLPTVPVDDILVHPREGDLIFGTHGRSIWVLDDATPLAELSDQVLASPLHLFSIRPAIQWRPWANTGSTGHKAFLGENPPNGAMIHYFLKEKPGEKESVRISILDGAGKVLRTLNGTGTPGVNRVVWDTRSEIPGMPPPAREAGPGGGGGFGRFGAQGPRVEPGTYTVKVKVGERETSGTVTIQEDPRLAVTPEARSARRALLDRLVPKLGPLAAAQRGLTQLRPLLNTQVENGKKPNARIPDAVKKAGEDLLARVDEVFPQFGTLPAEERAMGDAGPSLVQRPPSIPSRFQQLYRGVSEQSEAPTAWQNRQAELLLPQVDELLAKVRGLMEGLAGLNKLMNESGVPHIQVEAGGPGGGRRRQGD